MVTVQSMQVSKQGPAFRSLAQRAYQLRLPGGFQPQSLAKVRLGTGITGLVPDAVINKSWSFQPTTKEAGALDNVIE
jgi:hypothetical protein